MKNKVARVVSHLFVGAVFVFMFAPIVSIAVFSFNDADSLTRWGGFTLRRYQELFTDQELFSLKHPTDSVIIMTILIAFLSTAISTLLGTMAAVSLTQMRKRFTQTALQLNNIPIASPEIIIAVSLLVFFGAVGIKPGYAAMLLAHIAFSTPYVIITVYPKLKSLDASIEEAAYDLGASPLQSLKMVVLPQIKMAIIAGAAIAFTMSFDDFIISYFVSGASGDKNISIYLYANRLSPKPIINALSTIILLIIGGKVLFDVFKKKKAVIR